MREVASALALEYLYLGLMIIFPSLLSLFQSFLQELFLLPEPFVLSFLVLIYLLESFQLAFEFLLGKFFSFLLFGLVFGETEKFLLELAIDFVEMNLFLPCKLYLSLKLSNSFLFQGKFFSNKLLNSLNLLKKLPDFSFPSAFMALIKLQNIHAVDVVGVGFGEKFESAFGFGRLGRFLLTHEKLLFCTFAFVVASHFFLELVQDVMGATDFAGSLKKASLFFL